MFESLPAATPLPTSRAFKSAEQKFSTRSESLTEVNTNNKIFCDVTTCPPVSTVISKTSVILIKMAYVKECSCIYVKSIAEWT